VLIGVLKGAAIFLSDLARAIHMDNTFDFVAVSSYGRARVSSGAVKLIKDIDNPIEGRHVILVEDILDTGLTLSYLRGLMLQHKPASLKIATCLDKPSRRLVPIEADYVGFKIPNHFVIGYGWTIPRSIATFPTSASFPTTQANKLTVLFLPARADKTRPAAGAEGTDQAVRGLRSRESNPRQPAACDTHRRRTIFSAAPR